MKNFFLGIALALAVVVNSFAQPCPGALAIQRFDPLRATCGSTSDIVFTVYTLAPDPNVSCTHGPADADCFELPNGWSFVTLQSTSTVTEFGTSYEKFEVKLRPNQFTGGSGRVRNKAYCGTGTPEYSA